LKKNTTLAELVPVGTIRAISNTGSIWILFYKTILNWPVKFYEAKFILNHHLNSFASTHRN
jgi:hypothetical protein